MPDTPPAEGTIIQVTRAEPAANPKFIVDDSPLKASIITIFSLVFFGISLFGALMRLASAGDLNAIRALLMRDDTIGWLTSVATLLAPTFWLAWRTVRSWFKKKRDVEIVKAADNEVAMLASEVAPAPAASPPTRARETATPGVRLLDASVLHRGGLAPTPDYEQDRAAVLDLIEPALAAAPPVADGDVTSPGTASLIDDAAPVATAADTAPRIPGDALSPAKPDGEANTPEFMALHREWHAANRAGDTSMDWKEYLQWRGWTFVNRRWQPPVEEK